MKILLASGSPRRAQLLSEVGIEYRVLVTNVSEDFDESIPPELISEQIAKRKALAAKDSARDGEFVLAADTSVVIDGEILGKPCDEADARRMLRLLSGKTHTVYTGIAVICNGKTVTAHEATQVIFESLDDGLIDSYVSTKSPLDKAGAYGIQGYGQALVRGIKGDYFNVMGLPLNLLFKILKNEFNVPMLSWLEL